MQNFQIKDECSSAVALPSTVITEICISTPIKIQLNSTENMEVECWAEDWGIPSVDPECIKILAFSKETE